MELARPPLTYNPAVFDVANLAEAKHVILTPEPGDTADGRWELETPYLLSLINGWLAIYPNSIVLDFGCGVGRLAKPLIEHYGCRVIGIDISTSMRCLATSYVNSPRFFACTGDWPLRLYADHVIAVWALQHSLRPEIDLDFFRANMVPGARLFVVNACYRLLPVQERPSDRPWVSDGCDVEALLNEKFNLLHRGELDPQYITPGLAECSFWAVYER